MAAYMYIHMIHIHPSVPDPHYSLLLTFQSLLMYLAICSQAGLLQVMVEAEEDRVAQPVHH